MTIAIIIFIVSSSLAGFLAGLLGIGGGAVLVPMLISILPLFGISQFVVHISIATSISSILITSAMSTMHHSKLSNVDFHTGFRWGIFISLGAVVGSVWASNSSGLNLKIMYIVVLSTLSIYKIFRPSVTLFNSKYLCTRYLFLPFITGWLSSSIGIGAGSNVPLLSLFGMKVHRAIGTSAFLGFFVAFPSTIVYIYTGAGYKDMLPLYNFGFINLPALLGIIPLTAMFAPVGVRLASRIKPHNLNIIFHSLTMVFVAKMLWSILDS